MTNERWKMLAGELYDPGDPELTRMRFEARELCADFNASREDDVIGRVLLMRQLFGSFGDDVWLQPPFQCDYGVNIHLGDRVFINFNCTLLDVCEIRIGSHTLIGPGVQILTPLHPFDPMLRRTREYGRPITIGSDVWIGGGALILAGVRIGDRSVIGAGSVVARDIPDGVLAVGNPCRAVRELV